MLNCDTQRWLLVCVFLINVQGTRSQRAIVSTRRTDFLTEQQRLHTLILYSNEKGEANIERQPDRGNIRGRD